MLTYLLAIGLIFLLLWSWVVVQYAARRFAQRYPELESEQQGRVNSHGGCGLCAMAQMCDSVTAGSRETVENLKNPL